MHISFVILHYKTHDDTVACIESIKNIQSSAEISIVVVDNASNNGSYEAISDRYRNDSNIHFIHNDTNLGFARGNNVGYAYAKAHNVDFIAVLNNDIIIQTKTIVEDILSCYEKYRFAIMGPDVVSLVDHGHQNPPSPATSNPYVLKKRIRRYQFLRFLNQIYLYDIAKKFFGSRVQQVNVQKKCTEYKENVQLHGSFLIYSPDFIMHEPFAFCPETFLYTEEPILFRYCMKKTYKTLYCPDVVVFHKEDSSTNHVYAKSRKKREFVFCNLIRSHKIYYRHLLQDVDQWQ